MEKDHLEILLEDIRGNVELDTINLLYDCKT